MRLAAGQTIAHYEVLAPLGAGAMGEVYRARDTRLGREIALKILASAAASEPECLERFQREARALAALSHPNIVTVHSVEEVDGSHFLTMEMVEGSSLDQHIPAGGMEAERWLAVARSIIEALAAAHAKGIIHRDLKPANIMVTPDVKTKLVDFGLARSPGKSTNDGQFALTREGVALGTVPYMSPEQLRGRAVDERSDIFSLGVVLYEMATGRHPFAADSQEQVIAAILEEHPTLPVGPCLDLAVPVADIIGHCLVKDIAHRCRHVKDLLAELARENQAIEMAAGATSPTSTPVLSCDTRPDADLELPCRPSLAILPFSNLSGDPEQEHLATGLWFDLNAELIKVWGLFLINGSSTQAYKDQAVDCAQVGRDLGVAHVLQGAMRRAGDRIRLTVQLVETASGQTRWAETFDRDAEDLFALQDEINQRIIEELGVQLMYGERSRANRLRQPAARELYYRSIPLTFSSRMGDHQRARELLHEANRIVPGNSLINAMAGWTHYLEVLGGFDSEPSRALTDAERFADKSIDLEDLDGMGHQLKAALLLRRREHDAALETGRTALSRRPGCPWAYAILGSVHHYAGMPDRAVELAASCFRLSPHVPPLFPATMGWGYYFSDQHERAVQAANRAVELDAESVDALVALTASLISAEMESHARETATSLRRVRPDFTLDWFAEREPYRNAQDLERVLADLRKAGL